MKLAGKTDVGRVRQENQDDYRAGELPGGAVWALVCDGMGGARGGREASQGACNVIEQVFQEQYAQCGAGQEGAFLKKALISANRYGALGGLCGAVGMTLPSFIIILLLALLMENFATIPIVVHALNGIKVVVAALVLYSTYTMAKAGIKNIATLIIFLVALVLLALDLINPIIIVVASAAAGLIIGLIKKKKKEHGA